MIYAKWRADIDKCSPAVFIYSFFLVGVGGVGGWCIRTMGCGAAFIIQSGPFTVLRSRIPPVTDLVDGCQLAA